MAPLRGRCANNVEQLQDNTYGLPFYSRLSLRDPTIRFLLQEVSRRCALSSSYPAASPLPSMGCTRGHSIQATAARRATVNL
jgi:hypothetical protein